MSSHHIVLDEQEPALLVIDPLAVDRQVIDGLLEWSPTVVVGQSAVQVFLDWGVKVDYVMVESSGDGGNDLHRELYEVLMVPNGADSITFGLSFLQKKGYKAVNIIGNPTNLPLFGLQICHQLDLVLFDAGLKIMHIKSAVFKKWYSQSTELRLMPLAEGSYFSTKGFVDILTNQRLEGEHFLATENDGTVEVISNLKSFLIAEKL